MPRSGRPSGEYTATPNNAFMTQLFVSPKTVDYHLQRICRKL